jgi:ankyrin repeat protein
MNCNQRLALAIATLTGADATPGNDDVALQSALDDLALAIDEGADIDVPDENGVRAIDALAAGRNDPWAGAALQFLVESGAAANQSGLPSVAPPLHVACHRGAAHLVQGLLEGGAPVDAPGNSVALQLLGATPAHALALGFRGARAADYAQCFSLLIKHGADLGKTDRRRRTPVDVAAAQGAASGDMELVRALFEFGVRTTAGAAETSDGVMKIVQALTRGGKESALAAMAVSSNLRSLARSVRASRASAP